VYEKIAATRSFFYHRGILVSKQLPCPVISVGNLTIGGTGKTPLTIYLAQMMPTKGMKTAILSRGYKGAFEKKGGIVSDGHCVLLEAAVAGDEPYMMASRLNSASVLVGQNRFEMGLIACSRFQPDVILLDDGFQHLQLKRDINLLLLDGQLPFGNHHLLPRGPLREPLQALERADAFILTRCPSASPLHLDRRTLKELKVSGKPLFFTRHIPVIRKIIPHPVTSASQRQSRHYLKQLRQHRLFAFSGLAHNTHFHSTIRALDGQLCGSANFPDHHPYQRQELEQITQQAQHAKADMIVTTYKDFVRLPSSYKWPTDLLVLDVDIDFGKDETRFLEFIFQRLDKIAAT
jgi:tetraacyldisaccharide 4'-kinase